MKKNYGWHYLKDGPKAKCGSCSKRVRACQANHLTPQELFHSCSCGHTFYTTRQRKMVLK